MDHCAAKSYQTAAVVKEISSGVNDPHPKLLKLLTGPTIGLNVVEHKDRLTHHAHTQVIRGESYRQLSRRKEALLKAKS